jgi:type IV pilus assembly protein PilB
MPMPAVREQVRIGDVLVANGVISTEVLADALARQRDHQQQVLLGEVLVGMGACREEDITKALAEAYGLPFVRVNPRLADPKVVNMLPRDFLEQYNVLPLFKVRDVMTVAVGDPTNLFLIEEVACRAGCNVQAVVSPEADIRAMLQSHLPNANVFVIDEIIEDVKEDDLTIAPQQVEEIADLEQAATDSPVVKLVNYLLFHAVREQASDIHIEPGERALRVRYRVDGLLYEKVRIPMHMHPAVLSRVKIMANLDIAERRLPQDGGIHVLLQGRPVDLRVSTISGKYGEKAVIRIIDNQHLLISLEKLGFSYETLRTFRQETSKPGGMVLVSGPTGSGKTTTLYSVLQELNSDEKNICTIEDPIEYSLQAVNQFQVNTKIDLTFATILRSLLRQDPDIIMIGEIRDQVTATTAVQAALTGHLVLSTLHTTDAPSAVTRLLNLGIEPYLIAAGLNAVLAQRLVRKICPNCKERCEPAEHVKRFMAEAGVEIATAYRGRGCSRCRKSGFAGRIGVFELLVPDNEMRDMITRMVSLSELRDKALQHGMIALRHDGFAKVKSGITTVEEVLSVTAG